MNSKNPVLIPFLTSLTFLFSFWALSFVNLPVDSSFLTSHVEEFSLENSKYQLLTYIALVCALGIASLLILLMPNSRIWEVDLQKKYSFAFALGLIILPYIFGVYTKWFAFGFFSAIAVSFLIACRLTISVMGVKLLYMALVFFMILYVLLYLVMPFFTPPVILNGVHFNNIESHYALTVAPGLDLISATNEGGIQRTNYGLSMIMLSAIAYSILSGLGVEEGQLFLIVRVYQIVALGLLLFLIYRLNKTHFWLISAIALISTYSLNTLGASVYHPNQAGIRYIPFMIGIIVLTLVVQKGKQREVLLASIAALLILLSPETGIPLFCGYALYLLLSKYDRKSPLITIISTGIKFSVTTLFFISIFFILILFVNDSSYENIYSFLPLFGSGYGGLVDKPNAISFFLVFFASSALIRGVFRTRAGQASSIDIYQSAIGAVILTWLPYYVNRMAEWNLWFHGILLVALLSPRLNIAAIPRLMRNSSYAKIYCSVAIALVGGLIFVSIDHLKRDSINYERLVDSAFCNNHTFVGGYCITGEDAETIHHHLEFLKTLNDRKEYIVLSHFPAQVKIMGFNKGFPWNDVYGEVARDTDMANLTKWLERSGPKYIVTEDPARSLSKRMNNRTKHLENIVKNTKGYEKLQHQMGWVIYKRS